MVPYRKHTQAALWRGPCGQELKAQTRAHSSLPVLCDYSWEAHNKLFTPTSAVTTDQRKALLGESMSSLDFFTETWMRSSLQEHGWSRCITEKLTRAWAMSQESCILQWPAQLPDCSANVTSLLAGTYESCRFSELSASSSLFSHG